MRWLFAILALAGWTATAFAANDSQYFSHTAPFKIAGVDTEDKNLERTGDALCAGDNECLKRQIASRRSLSDAWSSTVSKWIDRSNMAKILQSHTMEGVTNWTMAAEQYFPERAARIKGEAPVLPYQPSTTVTTNCHSNWGRWGGYTSCTTRTIP